MSRIVYSVIAALVLLVTTTPQLKSGDGDWPGWRGPDRTGLSTETGLLKEWPADGPKLLWKIKGLGDGYSTPSVANGRIFVLGTKGREERLIALDIKDGKELWATPFGAQAGSHPGARSTPTVDGDLVYVISSDGKLICADTAKGEIRWRKDLVKDFGGEKGSWAYAESPLIDGDNLICTPGGSSATLAALNKKTGEVIWKAPVKGVAGGGKRGGYTTAGYSSAIAADIGGTRQYIQFIAGGVVGIAAKDGHLLWNYDHPSTGHANCSTPIFQDGTVFAASAYGNGGGRAKIVKNGDTFKAEEMYFVKAMENHHGGMVLVGDYLYGTNSTALVCVDFKTGKVAWTNRSVGKGSIAYADGHLYVRSENGPIALVEATGTAYKETGRFTPVDRSREKAWAHPVIAGGRLYVRDWDGLACYDVKGK